VRVGGGAATVGHDAGAAVPADVVEGVHLTVVVADDDQREGAEFNGDVVAGVRDLRLGGGEEPLGAEDALYVEGEQAGVGVERCVQGGTERSSSQQIEHTVPVAGRGRCCGGCRVLRESHAANV
jgi:hypothetical protein